MLLAERQAPELLDCLGRRQDPQAVHRLQEHLRQRGFALHHVEQITPGDQAEGRGNVVTRGVLVDDEDFLAQARQRHANVGYCHTAPNPLATCDKGDDLQLLSATEQATQAGSLIDAEISHDAPQPQPCLHWPSSSPVRRRRICAGKFQARP